MTSLSPSSSLSHHVFLSFHGVDVRKAFLSHILKEFRRKGIDPFIDNEIKRGASIGSELNQAIKGSKIAIILLSRNYASSSWCLDEMVEIMNCRETLGQMVITIFYEVDPSDVKKQTGDFGKVFRKTCADKTNDVVGKWRQALANVATIAGYDSSNWDNEAAMIEKITSDISKMLNHLTPSRDFDGLIGMGAHMGNIEPLLRLDLEEVRMIGIWGPHGIGKTTIARVLVNQISHQFQLSTIVLNIKVSYPRPCHDEYSASVDLQKQLLSQLFKQKDIDIPHLGIVQERLNNMKVLVVLDDVDQSVQLDAMAYETRWFGPGSRIIITTEDLRVLYAHGINHIYKVEFPSSYEALQMFCMYAFGQKSPKEGFENLAREVTSLVGELPLGLKVMGSHFRRMSEQEWTKALPRLRTRLDGQIESTLKFSYDALCDEDKGLFLHIACFFNFGSIERVEEHLAKSFLDVAQGLRVLTEKSLITINCGYIEMDNLLEQLGREIVRRQSLHEPEQRQFLLHSRDICQVLSVNTKDSRSVIGIDFVLSEVEGIFNISERAFEGMLNLQFVRFHGDLDQPNRLKLLRGLNYQFRNLRTLSWKYCHMPILPAFINWEFLVEIELSWSKLEKLWEGIQPLRNLKWMDMSYSENLKELPDLSSATNLKDLNLSHCQSLKELPSSIGNAINLEKLNLHNCSSLVNLPSSIGNATNLQKLDLSECSSLAKLPDSIGKATSLKKLNLSWCTRLVELPSSIGNATSLEKLDLSICLRLAQLPSSIGNAINLQKLNLSCCSNLVELPYSIGIAINLKKLDISHCGKLVSLPQLPYSLSYLNAENCESLKRLDCLFHNPDIHINFGKCFKLNQEARDLITKTSARGVAVLPGGQVPM